MLEDLHWADDQTLALLRALPSLRRRRAGCCSWSPAGTTSSTTEQSEVLAALARLGPVRVGLGGLDREAVAELVRATCVREVDEEAVHTIVERTGGNPFFVRETARLLDAESVDGQASAAELMSVVPSGVRDVLRRRIARLPATAQQILLQAAVIGRDVDVDVLIDVSATRTRWSRRWRPGCSPGWSPSRGRASCGSTTTWCGTRSTRTPRGCAVPGCTPRSPR